jgi:hypothetical protein
MNWRASNKQEIAASAFDLLAMTPRGGLQPSRNDTLLFERSEKI